MQNQYINDILIDWKLVQINKINTNRLYVVAKIMDALQSKRKITIYYKIT